MPTGFNPPLLFLRALDHEGLPAPGAKLYHRVAGTELPKAIYYDAALTSECPQPLVADAEGRFPQFFLEGGAYRFVLFDQSDVQLRPPEDPIWGANGGSIFPTPTNSGFLYYDEDTDTYSWIQVEGSKVKVDADDPVAGYLSEKLTDSDTVHWEVLPDHSGIQAVVQEGAGDTYKTKVNADDTAPGFLEQKLADTTDTQFSPTEDGSQLDNIVYQLTGLGTRLNRVKDAGFDFDRGPFPAGNYAGGRGISFGRRYVAGVEVDTWIAQGNNGKLYWTSNNDATRWKITTEDDSVYSAYPGGRTYYGWSCIQFVYVAGAHNCFCWVMGSGDLAQTVVFIEHKPENYNADGTFKTAALNSVTYGPLLGPYSAIDIMQVDTTGGIFIAGDDTRVGYTTDLATFQVVLTADHNVGGLGFDGETTVQVVERDSGVIWKSENYGNPGTFSKVLSFYLDDVLVSHFPTDFSAQWGSMFSMYGQWLSINFHYVSGGIGFIYSDDGIYWYSSKDEATPFYDANNDGLRWFATNAVPNSGTPIYQLIVSMIPVHRRLSIEKGAVVSGPLILRELTNVPILGTDHRGRIVNRTGSLSLSELSDVEVSSPTAGQVLKHDGTKWVNGTPATGATEYDAVCSSEAELVAALTSATVQSIYIRIPSGGEYTLGSATTSLVVGATKRIYGEAVFLGGIAINPNGFTMRWRNQKVDVTGAASFAAGGSVYIKNVNIQGGTLNGTSGTRQYEQCNTAASVSVERKYRRREHSPLEFGDRPMGSGFSRSHGAVWAGAFQLFRFRDDRSDRIRWKSRDEHQRHHPRVRVRPCGNCHSYENAHDDYPNRRDLFSPWALRRKREFGREVRPIFRFQWNEGGRAHAWAFRCCNFRRHVDRRHGVLHGLLDRRHDAELPYACTFWTIDEHRFAVDATDKRIEFGNAEHDRERDEYRVPSLAHDFGVTHGNIC